MVKNNKWYPTAIEKSAEINGQVADINPFQRAKRPIIEFTSGLKLFNFNQKKDDID